MIPLLVGWLVKRGLSSTVAPKAAKGIAILGGVLLAVLAFFLWLHFHDRGVISTNNAHVEVNTLKADKKADNIADHQRQTDDARKTAETDQLQAILTKGQTDEKSDPAAYRATRSAFYDCLRRQAAARNGGQPPPDCRSGTGIVRDGTVPAH